MTTKSKHRSRTPSDLDIKKGTVILPADGLKPRTTYIVEVAFSPCNVIHRTLFYTGFLNGKGNTPGGYNEFLRTEDHLEYRDIYFLKFIEPIDMYPDKKAF